ncbi:MAG: flagellar protein FlaG [Betaproteobacteria bacterium]
MNGDVMDIRAITASTVVPRLTETSSAEPVVRPAPSAAKAESERDTEADLSGSIKRAQEVAQSAGANLEFSVDRDSGKTVVRVMDGSTQQLIRQIPSEEWLVVSRNLDRMKGMLLGQKA